MLLLTLVLFSLTKINKIRLTRSLVNESRGARNERFLPLRFRFSSAFDFVDFALPMHHKTLSTSKSSSHAAGELLPQDYIVGVVYDKAKDACLMIHHQQRGGFWFPYSERRPHETSLQAIKRLIEPLVAHDTDHIHLVKVCSTKTLPFRARDVLFYAIVPHASASINVWLNAKVDGVDFDRQIQSLGNGVSAWLTVSQLRHVSKVSRLLGPEPLALNKQFKDVFCSSTKPNPTNPTVIFEEVKVPQIEAPTKTGPSAAETLLISAKFTSTMKEQLFEDYYQAASPSDYLNVETFKELIGRRGAEPQRLLDYFRAFDSTQRSYLTFADYLLGLAALDPNTQHGGVPAEQRCRYIFRYYNLANNQRMTFEEFKAMIKDIHTLKGQNLTGDALNDEALQTFRSFGLRSSDQTLNLMDFLSGVGQLRFRGTSVLFRLTLPMTELLKRPSSIASNPMIVPSAASSHGTKSNRTVSTITMGRRPDIQQSPIKLPMEESSHPYEIATHIVKVS